MYIPVYNIVLDFNIVFDTVSLLFLTVLYYIHVRLIDKIE